MQHDVVVCPSCRRRYARPAENVVEMISADPQGPLTGIASGFYESYLATRVAPLALSARAVAWGAPETMPRDWVLRRRRYAERVVNVVLRLLGAQRGVVLDTSAGAGYISFALAGHGLATIHADLDPQSIGYAVQGGHAAPSLLVVRADYFALPLRHTADVVVATDSLIRGVEHELAALRAIRLALKDEGFAVVDFHNWLHNPLRRLGFLPDNFAGNRSYLFWGVRSLLRRAGLTLVEHVAYRQEEDQTGLRRVLAPLLPATRFLIVAGKARDT